jgi:hypothetical protein
LLPGSTHWLTGVLDDYLTLSIILDHILVWLEVMVIWHHSVWSNRDGHFTFRNLAKFSHFGQQFDSFWLDFWYYLTGFEGIQFLGIFQYLRIFVVTIALKFQEHFETSAVQGNPDVGVKICHLVAVVAIHQGMVVINIQTIDNNYNNSSSDRD